MVELALISHLAALVMQRMLPFRNCHPRAAAASSSPSEHEAASSSSSIRTSHFSPDSMSGLTYGAYGATSALAVVGLCKSLEGSTGRGGSC